MIHHRGIATVWIYFVLALCVFVAPVGLGRADAATPDVYEVSGISVDNTAETASDAKKKALSQAHELAFRRLLERLTQRVHHEVLPVLSAKEIEAYVSDFSIAQEKSSTTRYLATLNFRFKREEIRNLLTDHGVRFAETPSKPVLVLAVYEEAGALYLWDTPNPWREAWEANPPAGGLVPMVLPLGDLTDIAAIGAEQAARGNMQRLMAIGGRYDTDDVLVAQGVRGIDARGTPMLEVTISRFGSPGGEQTLVRTFASEGEEPPEVLLARAVAEIANEIEDGWKRDNQLQFEKPAILAVRIPISGLKEWIAVRERLSGVALIRYTDIVLISRSEVRANLHFIGNEDQLTVALAQADLTLNQDESEDWMLRSQRKAQ
ncbi:MAG: DUF2066 domain-containing protein [Rhodospirillales bacterium]|jgi:hypothetical protein|nr:DUF2066 domain-containing protein [Rhodospirillales bacterium]